MQGVVYYVFSSKRLGNNGSRSILDTIHVINSNCDNDESVNSQTVWIKPIQKGEFLNDIDSKNSVV